MSDVQQIHEDLRYVRQAVARREQAAVGPRSIYWVWAVYVLIGYTMTDFDPRAAGWFFMAGGIVGGVVSWQLGKRWALRRGESDMSMAYRSMLHWAGGIGLAVICSLSLAAVIPPLREHAYSGQVLVVLIGMDYFLAGVHFDRNFLWLGPVLMAGGILVGLVPHYGWTSLGVVIALGLTIPTLIPVRRVRDDAQGRH